MKYDEIQISQLEERYFEGKTSEAEETVLRQYLSEHPSGHEELRAVMSYFAVAHQKGGKKISVVHSKTNHFALWLRVAAVLVALVAGFVFFEGKKQESVCVAYVNGNVITEEEEVMHYVKQTMVMVRPEETMENQLKSIFREEE